MMLKSHKRLLAIVLPILLIISAAGVFWLSSRLFGENIGYLTGFVFYWIFWCLFIPWRLTNLPVKAFFIGERPLFIIKNIWIILLLAATIIMPIFIYTIPVWTSTPTPLILLGIPLAVIHSFFEEMFWRGFYIKQYRESVVFSVIIPSVFFMLWHIAPQLAFSQGISIQFIAATLPLGLVYTFTAFMTKSALWSFFAHSLSGIFAFSGYLSQSLVNLFHNG